MHVASYQSVSPDALGEQAALWIGQRMEAALRERQHVTIALSGGSTPAPAYRALAANTRIAWEQVRVILVDDRCVGNDHAESNQRLIAEAFGSALNRAQVIFPNTELSPDACAMEYEQRLRTQMQTAPIDIAILGMGTDGHTASLFPPVPREAFADAWVLHTRTDAFAIPDRISLSASLLARTRSMLLLIAGEEKHAVYTAMCTAQDDPVRWPLHALAGSGALSVLAGL